jgi:hypothetical protein
MVHPMVKELGKGCAAVLVVFLALLFGAGGGCLIGGMRPTHSRDWMAGLDVAIKGALIGAGLGLLVGLVAALVIARRNPHGADEDGQPNGGGGE